MFEADKVTIFVSELLKQSHPENAQSHKKINV